MKFMDDTIVKGTIESDRIIKEGEAVLYKTYNRFPVVFARAQGVHLYDQGGNEYLDFGAGISVVGLGYGDEHVNQAMHAQIDSGLLHTSNLFYNEASVEAGEKLLAVAEMDKVFFTNSGTEAIEGALKIARRYQYNKGNTDKIEIIAMENSFHGRSMGAVSVTGKEAYRTPFGPLIPGVKFAKFNDLDSVKALMSDKTCAIIAEPLQGEGGVFPGTEEFLRGLRELADQYDALLIFDEIQCGMGRTGYYFAWQEYDVKPDVMTVAKAIGNGVPLGAFLACGEAATAMKPGDHGSTYGGNPFVCAAASAVLDVFKERDIPGRAKAAGMILWDTLEELKEKYPTLITAHRGKGLIQGLEFAEGVDIGQIVTDCLMKEHLVLISASHNTIRFVPPLVIERKEILDMAERLERVLKNKI